MAILIDTNGKLSEVECGSAEGADAILGGRCVENTIKMKVGDYRLWFVNEDSQAFNLVATMATRKPVYGRAIVAHPREIQQ